MCNTKYNTNSKIDYKAHAILSFKIPKKKKLSVNNIKRYISLQDYYVETMIVHLDD